MSLKLSNNNILGTKSSILETLKVFTNLKKLDLASNNFFEKKLMYKEHKYLTRFQNWICSMDETEMDF